MSYVLIVGATSDIARATAGLYAEHGYDLYLAARDVGNLKEFARNVTVKTQRKVETVELDILDYNSHQTFYNQLQEKPLGVISFVGYLGSQEKARTDFTEAKRIMETNYTGVVSLFNIIARDFVQKKSGFMIGVSSAAGDRGRGSNFIYGSAKAALTTYLSGLRQSLADAHVHVMTVKPGFVATRMTAAMNLPQMLTAKPESVAVDIYNAQQNNRNIIYTKWIWRWIMMVIKVIPEGLFKRMNM